MNNDLLYDRSRNISGVALISDSKYTPSYGSSVSFSSENAVFSTKDNYYQSLPRGINNVVGNFNLVYKVDEVGARELANYYESFEGSELIPVNTDPSIYKQTSGYCTSYSINHINNQNYEVKASVEVIEASSVLSWKGDSFLNYNLEEWKWDKDYQKNDIVYILNNDLKVNNFFYCTKNHKSSSLNSPIGQDTAWTQDFFWEPDLSTNTQVSIKSEKYKTPGFTTLSNINKNSATFPLNYSFSNISDKQIKAMLHFLDNKCGYKRFKHSISSVYNRPKVFICPSWSHTFVYNNNHNLSVSFEEDPLGVLPRKSTFDSNVNLSIETNVYDENGDLVVIANKDNPLEGGIENSYYQAQTGIHSVKIGNSASYIAQRAFADNPNISGELKIPNTIERIEDYAFAGFFNSSSGCRFAGSLDIPDSVGYVNQFAFRGIPFDGGLTLGENIRFIGNGAFEGCSKFTGDLKIRDKTTSLGPKVFRYCSGFNGSLDLGYGLEKIYDFAFEECTGFTGSLNIPNTTEYIGNASFRRCYGFGELNLGSGVELLGNSCFSQCTGLFGPLELPDSLTGLGTNCFFGCENLDGGLTMGAYLTEIPQGVFANCYNLTGEIKLSQGMDTLGISSFLFCAGFSSVDLNDSLRIMERNCFSDCSGINSIEVPDSVIGIGDSAFRRTASLESFYINLDSSVFTGTQSFESTNTGLNIYVRQPHLSSYNNTWSGSQGLPNGVTIQEWI